MARETVLVVEDERDICELIRYNLDQAGFDVLTTDSGEAALEIAKRNKPDIVLLDLMLPGLDGLDVCRRLKSDPATNSIRVIMVTARNDEPDVVIGLELGADDYVAKPFSPRVLIARTRAVLRRDRQAGDAGDAQVRIHNLQIDPARHSVAVDGDVVDLTATEFKILHWLARRPGWVFTRSQIVDGTRGVNYAVTERSIDVQIVAIRKKLGESGSLIETVRGVGYRFRE